MKITKDAIQPTDNGEYEVHLTVRLTNESPELLIEEAELYRHLLEATYKVFRQQVKNLNTKYQLVENYLKRKA